MMKALRTSSIDYENKLDFLEPLALNRFMNGDPYGKEALEKYAKLIKATVSGNLEALNNILEDESIDIQLLVPAEASALTSAVALAIDSNYADLIEAYVKSTKIDLSRPVGLFNFNGNLQRFNIANYALFKDNFELAERLLRSGKVVMNGYDFLIAAYFYFKKSLKTRFMDLVALPNAAKISSLSNEIKLSLLAVFKSSSTNVVEIFDLCYPILEDASYEVLEKFYTFIISPEWYSILKERDMLKYINKVDYSGRSVIFYVMYRSPKDAKILFDYGADIHLPGQSLICCAERKLDEFLQLFPFTEDDFKAFLRHPKVEDRLSMTKTILQVYPHYELLITLENAVLSPLENVAADFPLIHHYKDLIGLPADSNLWLEILVDLFSYQNFDCQNYYPQFKNAIERLSKDYGQEFDSFFQSNLSHVLHLMIEKGFTEAAFDFADEFMLDFSSTDEAGISAFLKLLTLKNDPIYDCWEDVFNPSLINSESLNKNGLFFHQPDLILSEFTLRLVCITCQAHNIEMFEADPHTGKTLVDRVLEQEKLEDHTVEKLLSCLVAFETVLTEQQAIIIFTKKPKFFYEALAEYSAVLPTNIWELQVADEVLIEVILKGTVTPSCGWSNQFAEQLYPHFEKLLATGDFKVTEFIFEDLLKSGNSEKYLKLLQNPSIRRKISDRDIMKLALKSESINLLHFALEELDISANILIDNDFPLQTLIRERYSLVKEKMFDLLLQSGAVISLESMRYPFSLDPAKSEWVDKLVDAGYMPSEDHIITIKNKLNESFLERNQLGLVDYFILSNTKLCHLFSVYEKSFCLLYRCNEGLSYDRLVEAGADPRLVITSDGESVLHVLKLHRMKDPTFFFQEFKITEIDLTNKCGASYSPFDKIMEVYSDDLSSCPVVCLYPSLFNVDLSTVCIYSEAKTFPIAGDKTMCSICREDYIDDDKVLLGLCKHLFHFECFNQLEEGVCPVCSEPLFYVH